MGGEGAVAWSWRNVGFGATLAVPAVVATAADPATGLPLAIGVLPAAALGIRGPRRRRHRTIAVGVIAGASMFLGALVAPVPIVAVAVLFAGCVVVAVLVGSPRHPLAPLVMTLGLPLFGAGLSETSWVTGLGAALLIVAGSVYGWLVSLLWPSLPVPAPGPAPHGTSSIERSALLLYGVQIGLTGAAAAALGFALGVDHPGWASTSALLVSRPDPRLRQLRAVGRAASVTAGATVACVIALLGPGGFVLAGLVLLTLAVACGTAGSRWYVFPFFSTVIVLSLLLLGEPDGPHWFVERVGLTLLGVGLALAFGWLVPRAARVVRPTARRG